MLLLQPIGVHIPWIASMTKYRNNKLESPNKIEKDQNPSTHVLLEAKARLNHISVAHDTWSSFHA